ncbi:MAG: hypothetical protein WCP03_04315 [Candidatus Saccharibacteria bacterium]
MIKIKKMQQGFAVVELAIFVVVIVAVAGIGYWALKSSKAVSSLTDSQIIQSISYRTFRGGFWSLVRL